MSDRKRKKSSLCKRKRESSVEAAILNYYSQDVSDSAQELKTALSKLRQMRLDIFMKLIVDHNQAISADEELLRKQLAQRCPCIGKPLADCNCEPDSHPEFAEVTQALKAAISSLQDAYLITEKKLDKSLHVAVIAAMNACQEAFDLLQAQPDEE